MSYFETPISWSMATPVLINHAVGFYGFYLAITGQSNWKTILFILGIFVMSGLSVTIGAHRLFTHRCFEVNRMLKIALLFWFSFTAQYSIYEWVRNHRTHHKYSDTDADPHNVKRGFFFSHFGWLCLKKTQEFEDKAKTIDLTDLTSDQDIMFQSKYLNSLIITQWYLVGLLPCYFWNESLLNSACTIFMGWTVILHHTSAINSICHGLGWRPYDTGIEPTFYRLATYLTWGEGYHNFHHTFPRDYSASELKWAQNYNPSTLLIDLFEHFGWVTNKTQTDPELIRQRRLRTGTHTVKVSPWSVILDYVLGFITVYWLLWVVFALRYFMSADAK